MFKKVIDFPACDEDPLYLPEVSSDMPEERLPAVVDPSLASHHGVEVDPQGFPVLSSLEAWHRKHNPHLFND